MFSIVILKNYNVRDMFWETWSFEWLYKWYQEIGTSVPKKVEKGGGGGMFLIKKGDPWMKG